VLPWLNIYYKDGKIKDITMGWTCRLDEEVKNVKKFWGEIFLKAVTWQTEDNSEIDLKMEKAEVCVKWQVLVSAVLNLQVD
jgi:hypothetical protein